MKKVIFEEQKKEMVNFSELKISDQIGFVTEINTKGYSKMFLLIWLMVIKQKKCMFLIHAKNFTNGFQNKTLPVLSMSQINF